MSNGFNASDRCPKGSMLPWPQCLGYGGSGTGVPPPASFPPGASAGQTFPTGNTSPLPPSPQPAVPLPVPSTYPVGGGGRRLRPVSNNSGMNPPAGGYTTGTFQASTPSGNVGVGVGLASLCPSGTVLYNGGCYGPAGHIVALPSQPSAGGAGPPPAPPYQPYQPPAGTTPPGYGNPPYGNMPSVTINGQSQICCPCPS